MCPGALALAFIVAGCTAPLPTFAPSTTVSPPGPPGASATSTSGPAGSPDLANFGIPGTIGSWHLVGSAEPIDPAGPMAAIIGEAGGDLATAKVLHVEVSVGADLMAFDVLRVPGASLDAFTAAAAPRSAEIGITERSSRTLSGWTVIRYSTPADYVGPPRA
jgi:hypothetical protein